jgi:hypothetical protein
MVPSVFCTIYQAAGLDYVGIMHNGGRAMIRINVTIMFERQAGRLFGSQGALALAKLGLDVITVKRKARYFAFRGSRAEQREHRAAIAPFAQAVPPDALRLVATQT